MGPDLKFLQLYHQSSTFPGVSPGMDDSLNCKQETYKQRNQAKTGIINTLDRDRCNNPFMFVELKECSSF